MDECDLIVIGGGAAGIFAALAAKEAAPERRVAVFEKHAALLAKVRISGGGRCNVTHACFDPALLVKNYPRGGKELLGPFHRFQPKDTVQWFESRGVKLKTEADGRMFPVTDSSETIIQCLLSEAEKLGVPIYTQKRIEKISKKGDRFELELPDGPVLCKQLLLATGSSKEGYNWAASLGHTIQAPVPSLFTFNIPTSPLKECSGIVVDPVELKIAGTTLSQRGPLLVTHFGFSGPAVLKLSAWGARVLNEKEYKTDLIVNWTGDLSEEEIFQKLLNWKNSFPQKNISSENLFQLPKNLWKFLVPLGDKKLCDTSHQQLRTLAIKLSRDVYHIEGKTTHKEEFVTCGGITLKEVDFKTLQSKVCPGLVFAGEILDIDGVTGGFNFQSAWTTGFIAGVSSRNQ